MNKYIVIICMALAGFLHTYTAKAQYNGQAYTVTNLKDISVMTNNNDTMMLYDGLLESVNPVPSNWKGNYCVRNPRGTVALKIKKDLSGQVIPESFTCNVTVAVRQWTTNQTGSLPAASNITLKISYDKRKGMVYDEAALKVFNEAHYIWLKFVSISNTAYKDFLQLQINMDGERYYCKPNFDVSAKPCILKTEYKSSDNEWEVTMKEDAVLKQADEFDLEWVFVDYYDKNAYNFTTKLGTFQFENNATRVILGKNQHTFRLKNIFERGFVLFRYRTVAYYKETISTGEEVTLRLTGAWSDAGATGFSGNENNLVTAADCSGMQSALAIIMPATTNAAAPHLEKLNWQYISVFAEEAKTKETMAYYDGSMRARQSLATDNSIAHVLVQENVYDFNGRSAIQVLPVPVNGLLTFYPNLNTYKPSGGSAVPYTAYHFDVDASSVCTDATKPFNTETTNSASAYYSPRSALTPPAALSDWNPDRYVPVAGGFPFTQTVFTRDNTGRIAFQSGVGETHHQGLHKTRYAYETPHQEELTRLFGTDVGYKDHYKKNTVIDANGQVSVSYLDLKGHTVATALAADPTSTNKMDALPAITPRTDVVVSLTNPGETQFREDEFVYSKKLFVPETGNYKFSYSLSPQDYQASGCASSTPCYDCRYDLEIKLVDQCGQNVLDGDATLAGTTLLKRSIGGTPGAINYAASCSTNTAYNFTNDAKLNDNAGFISVSLEPGEYTVVRTLRINEADYRLAEKHYLENSVCTTLQTFVTAETAALTEKACFVSCAQCEQQFYPNGRAGSGAITVTDFLASMVTQFGRALTAEETAEWTKFYYDTKKKCDELSCGNRSTCDVTKDILVNDITPGGQYAAFSYDASNVFTVTPQLFNVLDPAFIAALPESLTVYIYNESTQSNQLVQARTLSPEAFVNNWNPDWAEHLFKFHPEYCEYTHCLNNQPAFKEEMDYMQAETYDQAVAALLISGFTPAHDMSGTYKTIATTSTAYNLTVVQMVFLSIFHADVIKEPVTVATLNDLLNPTAMAAAFNICSGGLKNAYWVMLKGILLSERRKTLNAANTNCPPVTNTIIERRFYKSDGNWPELGNPAAIDVDDVNTGIANQCLSQCQAYREVWKENLKNCSVATDATAFNTLLDQLQNVCIKGCDENNPMGARTVSPANLPLVSQVSFEQVVQSFIDPTTHESIYNQQLCTDLLITMPAAYGQNIFSSASPFADTCECSMPTPPANCPCNGSGSYNSATNNTMVKLLRGESAPNNKCKTCFDCAETANAFYDFTTVYTVDFEENNQNTNELLVNFLNNKLGLSVAYADYELHLAKCLGYNTVPANTNVFALYAEANLSTRTFTTKETNLIAAVFQSTPQQQFKYEYRQRSNDYIIDYTRITPVYASVNDGILMVERTLAPPPSSTTIHPESMILQLMCICDKIKTDPDLFEVNQNNGQSDYFFDVDDNSAGGPDFTNRIKSICETFQEEKEQCWENNNRLAAMAGSNEFELGLNCNGVYDNFFQYLLANPLNVRLTNSGTNKFDCSCPGDCPPPVPDPIRPPLNNGEPTYAFCQGFMPYFETYYTDHIEDYFEPYSHTVSLMHYLGNSSLFDDIQYSDLLDFLVLHGIITDENKREDVIPRLWNALKLCRTVSCAQFMSIAGTYDASNYGSLTMGLRALAETHSSLPIYTDFKDLLNAAMNKPPYLVFFDDETIIKHFTSCAKGPCDLVTQKFADIKDSYASMFTKEQSNSITLRDNQNTSMMTDFLNQVNSMLVHAPYYTSMNANQLITAVDMCVSCLSEPYSTTGFQNMLDELVAKPSSSLFPLLVKSGWNLSAESPQITAAYYNRNAYRNLAEYQVVNQARNNSFLYAEARTLNGNYFYIKMATITNNSTSVAPFNYRPASPNTDFAFLKIEQFSVIRIVRFSQQEVQLIVNASYRIDPITLETQSLLITLPAYGFYKDYIANQACKHNNEICNKPAMQIVLEVNEDPCTTRLKMIAKANAYHKYNTYIAGLKANFRKGYIEKCMNRSALAEQFNMKYDQRQYHYTLYYYDQAGNLVKTVPPAGIVPLDATGVASADTKRNTGTPYSNSASQHTKATTYLYNSLNQLVQQQTPDAGISKFWYDKVGRIVFSQNAKQLAASATRFSYTFYDGLGRITEVGELNGITNSITPTLTRGITDLKTWLSTAATGTITRSQITRTFYDAYDASYSTDAAVIATDFKNLRGRVVHSATYATGTSTLPEHAVHYTYDMHGNVSTLYRETQALAKMDQELKKVNYYFDLVSGKVNKVSYQEGKNDQYLHQYRYDAENRLVNVKTGAHSYAMEEDANYYYYKHGPLARMEYGEHDVQGLDYTYTIQGWLKSVNSPTLSHERDPGRDGHSANTANKANARDVFGFELAYYTGDYQPVFPFANAADLPVTTVPSGAEVNNPSNSNYVSNLYNGNIRYMTTGIKGFSTLLSSYRYDQLNRIKKATYYQDLDAGTNTWGTGAAMDAYLNSFTYDADGNIMTQVRNGKAGNEPMDNLSYTYDNGTNRLRQVNDTRAAGLYSDDLDDQVTNNYSYDAAGNLVADAAEEIAEIKWNVYGKITHIIRRAGSHKPDLEFTYTPDGHRASKTVIPKNNQKPATTYYVRDAQGNVLATYNQSSNKVLDYEYLKDHYAEVNTKLAELAGAQGFADFIAQLHTTLSSDAAFYSGVHSAFTGNTAQLGNRLKEMRPEAILNLWPYNNFLLKRMNELDVFGMLNNGQFAYDACICSSSPINFTTLLMTQPIVTKGFFEALCIYDSYYSTTHATDILNRIYGTASCPIDPGMLTQIETDLDPLRDDIATMQTNFTDAFNMQGLQCDAINEVFSIMQGNDPIAADALVLITPTNTMLARWDDFTACGGSFDMIGMLTTLRMSFLKALHRSDPSLLVSLMNEAGIPHTDVATSMSVLEYMDAFDLATYLANIGVEPSSTTFRNIMMYVNILSPADFNGMMSAYAPASYSYTCAVSDVYTCMSNPLGNYDATTAINLAGGTTSVWSLLDGFNSYASFANLIKTNDKYNYLKVAAKYHRTEIGTLQQANSSMYGSSPATAAAAYFNYIRMYAPAYYTAMVNHFTNISERYADTLKLEEWMLYGSSRLGSNRVNKTITAITYTGAYNGVTNTYNAPMPATITELLLQRGNKRYELSNHLGNVLAVVSDKKVPVYTPTVLHSSDFSSSLNGWTAGWSEAGSGWPGLAPPYTTAALDAGRLKITATQAYGGARLLLNTTPGKTYTFTFTLDKGNVPSFQLGARTAATATTYSGSSVYWTTTTSSLTNYSFNFTATTALTQLLFEKYVDANVERVFYLDNTQVVEQGGGTFTHYEAELMQATDYSPFGAPLAGRTYNAMEDNNKVVIANQAFASGVDGWSTASTNTTVTNASGQLRLQTTNTAAVSMSKTYTTTADKKYRISFDVDAGVYTNVTVDVLGYNNASLSSATVNSGITRYQMDFIANDATTKIVLKVSTGSGTRTIYLDNVKLEQINGNIEGYDFGFNGMEKNDDIYGEGNEYSSEFRQYDPRIARWMSIDPEMSTYPGVSPYNFSFNNPILLVDPDGDDPLKDEDNEPKGETEPSNENTKNESKNLGTTPPGGLNLEGKREGVFAKIGRYLNSLSLFNVRKSYDAVPTDERKPRISSQKDFYKIYSLYKHLNYQVKFDMRAIPDEIIVTDPKTGSTIGGSGSVVGRGAVNIPGGTDIIKVSIIANKGGQTGFRIHVVSTEKSIMQTTRIYFLGIIPVSQARETKRATGESNPIVPKNDSYWLSAYERRRLR